MTRKFGGPTSQSQPTIATPFVDFVQFLPKKIYIFLRSSKQKNKNVSVSFYKAVGVECGVLPTGPIFA